MSTFANREDPDEMQHYAEFHLKGKKDLQSNIILPDTPRYLQWTIPNLLYQTRRKNPLVYKGLNRHRLLCFVLLVDSLPAGKDMIKFGFFIIYLCGLGNFS